MYTYIRVGTIFNAINDKNYINYNAVCTQPLMAPNAMESACVFNGLSFTKACRIHVILTKHSKGTVGCKSIVFANKSASSSTLKD